MSLNPCFMAMVRFEDHLQHSGGARIGSHEVTVCELCSPDGLNDLPLGSDEMSRLRCNPRAVSSSADKLHLKRAGDQLGGSTSH